MSYYLQTLSDTVQSFQRIDTDTSTVRYLLNNIPDIKVARFIESYPPSCYKVEVRAGGGLCAV